LGAKRTKNIWSTTWQKERESKHDEWLSFREIGAPFTGIGSGNLQVLITWLTEMLLPTIGAGKKIVLDNASFHRYQLVRKVVETAGCELIYLPKYSPALNPIEHPWHRIKQRVRKPMTSTTQQSS